jgi:hypothetical protein
MTGSAGPYARAAGAYWEAGWAGVLPLPAGAKSPPPHGYTGWAGVEPSGADVQAWVDGPQGAGNVALRLPEGVYGLDVDAYGSKSGATALGALVYDHGPLPPTWRVSARDDGVSGIRLYRAVLPPGRRWRDEPGGHGAGIEAIHVGHRYAVVWPSVHPDTGTVYRWYPPRDVDRGPYEGLPRPDELPELPPVWIEALSEPGEVATGEAAGHAETLDAVHSWPRGEPCTRTREAAGRALARLYEARDGAALHPAARDGVHELVRLGHEGHAAVRPELGRHFSTFVAVRTGRGEDQGKAEAEWWRLVRGAVGKLAGRPRGECDCALLSGEGLTFEFGQSSNNSNTENSAGESLESDDHRQGGEGGAGGLTADLRARLLSAAQVREIPAPRPLVEGLLSLDSESWMIAAPGAGKTFVALDIAGHVGVGKPWMGRPVHQGPVLYLVAEAIGGMGLRVRAWEQRNGPMAGVTFCPVAVQIGREGHWAALVEVAAEIRPVMVVIDTQARVSVGIKENDNTDMGRVIEAVAQLRKATRACVLVLHHTARGGTDARGASVIDGAQDTELRLTRTSDNRIVLRTDKQRDGRDDVHIDLELLTCELDGGGSSLVVGPPLTAVPVMPWEIDPTDRKARILSVLHDQFSEHGGTASQVMSILRERGWTADYPKSTFYRFWNDLQREDKIERVAGTQRWILPEHPRTEV